MDTSISFDVRAVEQFLKQHQHGPKVVKALRLRTASHWLDPTIDRLSSRMLEAYAKLCEIVEWPFNILDCGCMCGYLNHFMELNLPPEKRNFRYVGIDNWPEALKVAEEFQPRIDVRQADILKDELPGPFDYVWCSNIAFGDHDAVVKTLYPLATKALIFAQPPWAGNVIVPMRELGKVEVFNCGETTLYKLDATNHIRRTQDLHSRLSA